MQQARSGRPEKGAARRGEKPTRATRDLPARRAGAITGKTKGTGGGAGKVNVQDLSFTHYE